MTNLLLASASPRRRELLTLLGLPFQVTVPDVAETPQAGESPAALAARLSQAKAHACSTPFDPAQSKRSKLHQRAARSDATIIIACDTIVASEGEVLGKPRDASEATTMLRRLRGRTHTVYSATTLLEITTGRTLTDVAETQVAMRAYTDAELASYVASGDPLDKAGAYAIQHAEFHPVSGLHGCYANVMGLPLCHLTGRLCAWGVEPLQDVPAACQAYIGHRCLIHATILADIASDP